MKTVVVTRHAALLELLRERGIIDGTERVIPHVDNPDDIAGAHVIGVLPLRLAARAACVTEIPLNLSADDRGKELTIERMREVAGEATTFVVDVVVDCGPYSKVWNRAMGEEA